MKKGLLIAVGVCSVIGLGGCGLISGDNNTSETTTENQTEVITTASEAGSTNGTQEQYDYIIYYHLDLESPESEKSTNIIINSDTPSLSLSDLGFSKPGYHFKGWIIHRDIDNSWYVNDDKGESTWMRADKPEDLPEGYTCRLYNEGVVLTNTAKEGKVHFYGVWEKDN